MNDFQKMVVLIDADNTQLSKLESVLHEVSTYGRIVVKKAYGNWKKRALAQWEDKIKRLAIKAEQQFDYVAGKNTTDIAIVIDAMDLLNTEMYDAFVIVSSDSDFTPLAVRLKESGIYVIGVGEKKTPEAFCSACDNFIYLEYLDQAVTEKKEESSKNKKNAGKNSKKASDSDQLTLKIGYADPDISEIHTLLHIACDKFQDDDDFTPLTAAGNYIKRVKPEFNTKTYGFSKLSDLIKAFPELYEMKRYSAGNTSTIVYRCR
ncbi:MAG: NYN domain-containing protein [Spirochaetes bacterium]|uniref:NYN domain-containing protein n=1 Tax=Candidatus Ornithospirochaeta stercoripullorum TaxID=2840899 RepID=A0A9D9E0A7_9SPIO|nr:NYN domain-containing protein [Candidatus Ornithospirochaeta stercoripullorum]